VVPGWLCRRMRVVVALVGMVAVAVVVVLLVGVVAVVC
jgi:hypothetical protein